MNFVSPTQSFFVKITAVLSHPRFKLLCDVIKVECNFFSEQSRKLESGKYGNYKCFFLSHVKLQKPQAGIIKLE